MKVCIVCLGNICRSPMAEMVLRADFAWLGVQLDSAGIATGHAGQPMDPRALEALAARGYDGAGHIARQFEASWERDLILAADNRTLELLREMGKQSYLFGEFAWQGWSEIPDPFFGNAADFEHALDLIEDAAPAIIDRVSAMLPV